MDGECDRGTEYVLVVLVACLLGTYVGDEWLMRISRNWIERVCKGVYHVRYHTSYICMYVVCIDRNFPTCVPIRSSPTTTIRQTSPLNHDAHSSSTIATPSHHTTPYPPTPQYVCQPAVSERLRRVWVLVLVLVFACAPTTPCPRLPLPRRSNSLNDAPFYPFEAFSRASCFLARQF